jgi:hypothetical protein
VSPLGLQFTLWHWKVEAEAESNEVSGTRQHLT